MHTHVVKLGYLADIYVGNSLLNVYASREGDMELCRQLFDEMRERDVVSFTVLITGFRRAGKYDDALIGFEQMLSTGVVPNRVTMVNALAACGSFGAIDMGVWIHGFIKRKGWELDVILGTALIDMYGKCGRIEEGLSVFHKMKEKNIFTWNAIIKGLALAKNVEEAVFWFTRMKQEGFMADKVTLLEMLCACSHSGFVDMGRQIFCSLIQGKYGFSPTAKHYAATIDLLSRAGCLKDAFRIIRGMPFEPTKSMWGSLLSGCRTHGSLELSEFAAKKLVELEPESGAYHVALSNLYAEIGRWNDVEEARELMKDKGFNKELGCSSMEPDPQNHVHDSDAIIKMNTCS